MFEAPSFLSLVAAGFYTAVTLACLAAWSNRKRQPDWHGRAWLVLAVFFVVLVAMRITGFEEALRDSARAYLRAEDAFEGRRAMQRLILAGIVVVAGASGLWLVHRIARGSKRKLDLVVKAACLAGLIMFGLLSLRIVSLHAVDRLLYGALKLNWVGDIGASCAVLIAAGGYVWLTRQTTQMSRR